jgi:TPR repeat protein
LQPTLGELENMSEKELETLIMARNSNDDARFVLGRLMVEGTSDKVPRNENKGMNWIKEGVKKGHIASLEYKTYYDIRFDRTPKLEKITANLEKIIAANKSTRALNTMGELCHATGSGSMASQKEEVREAAMKKAGEAAKFYQMSAEQGDVIGTHWLGVFYHEGFGVNKNITKAIELLQRSGAAGNGQSLYQLYLIHSGNKG